MKKSEFKSLIKEILLNEIDWTDPDLADVKVQHCLTNDQVVKWMNDELPKTESEVDKLSAIVLPPGDSDRPAQRKDVKYIFLLKH